MTTATDPEAKLRRSPWYREELSYSYDGHCDACGGARIVGKEGSISRAGHGYVLRDPRMPWLCWQCLQQAKERHARLRRWWPGRRLANLVHHVAFGLFRFCPDARYPETRTRLRLLIRVVEPSWMRLWMPLYHAINDLEPPLRWFVGPPGGVL